MQEPGWWFKNRRTSGKGRTRLYSSWLLLLKETGFHPTQWACSLAAWPYRRASMGVRNCKLWRQNQRAESMSERHTFLSEAGLINQGLCASEHLRHDSYHLNFQMLSMERNNNLWRTSVKEKLFTITVQHFQRNTLNHYIMHACLDKKHSVPLTENCGNHLLQY